MYQEYQDVYGESAGVPDYQRPGGPTGIPDPNHPGYDTAGYPLPGRTGGPVTATNPPADGTPINGAQNSTTPPAPPAPPAKDPAPDPGGLDTTSGPLAAFGEAAPAFPTMAPFSYEAFKAPTMEDALNDPGYQFRLSQGRDALQNWAAARGTLNDSDTAKMLIDYGENSAEQGYGNVYARQHDLWQGNEQAAERQYGINRQTQVVDPYTAAYNGWVQRGNWYYNNQGNIVGAALGFAQLQ
jgi:hypothetical protein